MKNNLIKCWLLIIFSLINAASYAVEIYGHRGARGLAPENTIVAYKTALKIGVDFVDMDVGMTKEGVLVVTHDFSLNPDITRDAKGNFIKQSILIKNLKLKQIQQYDVGRINPRSFYAKLFPEQVSVNGERISTLRQVIQYVKGVAGNKIKFQIEIKTTPEHPDWTYSPVRFAKALAVILQEEHIIDRTEVQAFDFRNLLELHKINPAIKTAFLTDVDNAKNMLSSDARIAGQWSAGYLLKDYHNSIPLMIVKLGGAVWGPQDVELNKKLVDEAHAVGLKVVPWSWPEKTGSEFNEKEINYLINIGVDGIITDRPDKLKKMLVLAPKSS